MQLRMCFQPSARLQAVVAREIIGNNENVTCRILRFNVGKPRDVVLGVARGRTARQFLAIAHAQRSVHPGLLGAATVIQRRFDAVTRGRPAWSRWKGAGNYWP